MSGFFREKHQLHSIKRFKEMTQQSEYDRCLDTMYSLGRFGIVLGLSTMRAILEGLGNPHLDYKCIHVAGTNGKGSVASTLSSILTQAGYKTGLYTSPHLVSFNERICIDGNQITDNEVIEAYRAVEAVNTGERSATFFEISTAMAFYMFSKKNIDIAIIETGMGGRLDATNIISPVLSIITNISLEHKSYLGNTIKAITTEKAGIIKPDVPVVTGVRQASARSVVKQTALENNAPCYIFGQDFNVRRNGPSGSFTYYGGSTLRAMKTPLLGRHQIDNAALVLSSCEILNTLGISISETNIRNGFKSTSWPGRLEMISENPLTIVDGAHNLEAIKKLSAFLNDEFNGKKITLVTGILDDKSYDIMFKNILPLCSSVILTRANSDRSIEPEDLKGAAKKFSENVTVINDIPEAITYAENSSRPEDIICISGSLYVVGEAMEFFDNRKQGIQRTIPRKTI